MAGSDSQKQLLTLIREFASEKSQKERSLAGLRKTIDELRRECEVASAALENLKRVKETVEQEVKGNEVELAMADASIQTIEKRIAKFEDEISAAGSGIDELKKVEGSLRDELIREMVEKNDEIRKFQEIKSSILQIEDQSSPSSTSAVDTELKQAIEEDNEFDSTTIQFKLATIASQMSLEKERYQAEQSIYNQIQQELIDTEKKLPLMQAVAETTKELEELAKRTAEVEETCTSLGEELQKRSECPNCHVENLEAIQEFLHLKRLKEFSVADNDL